MNISLYKLFILLMIAQIPQLAIVVAIECSLNKYTRKTGLLLRLLTPLINKELKLAEPKAETKEDK